MSGTRLRLEYRGHPNQTLGKCSGQTVRLSHCSKHTFDGDCSSICIDGGKCAMMLNNGSHSKEHYVALGSNHVCSNGFHHKHGESFEVCVPNGLLRDEVQRQGSPCDPAICEWQKTERCVNSNKNLHVRQNDGSLEYDSCCGNTSLRMNLPVKRLPSPLVRKSRK